MKNYLKQFVTGLALLIVLSSCQQAALPQENQGNQPPQVKFQFEPNRGVALLEVNFDASSSSDDGSIVMYNWDFGDGSSATGVTTTHRFSSQGNYNVTLSIIDNEGLSASISQTILVQESAVPKPPEQPNPQENRRLVAEAYQLEIKLVPLFKQRLAESVSAAVIASLLANTGELVTTGTLTQLAPSVSMQQLSNAFRYDPNPNDHLRVVLLDGKEYELRYTDLQGTLDASLAQDGAAFVENDHKASVHIMSNEAAGSYNIQLDSLKFNGAIDVSIRELSCQAAT